jgi:hypothetical protein
MGAFVAFGFLGALMLLIGVIVVLVNLKNLARRRLILDTPTSPIARAPGGGLVEVKGRIVPSEQGVIVGPFSGRQGVYVRVVVQEYRSSGKSGHWYTVFNQAQEREFWVDDGSGQQARVRPTGASYILNMTTVQTSGTFRDASPQVEAFLNYYGMKSTSWLGLNKSMRYQEEMLCPGDPLYALGPSARVQGGPAVHDGYRTVPGTILTMYATSGPRGELILTNKSEQELVANLRTGFIVGVVMAVIGGLMAGAAALSAVAAALI